MFPSIQIILAGVVVLMLASGGMYLKGRGDGADACDARHAAAALKDAEERTKEGEKSAKKLEADLAAAREYGKKMERLVSYEVAKHGEYGTCVLPADGLRILNEAIMGQPAR